MSNQKRDMISSFMKQLTLQSEAKGEKRQIYI